MHTAETDQMLTREKKLSASLRHELDSVKKQMSVDKDKLSEALKNNAASASHVTGMPQLTGLVLSLPCFVFVLATVSESSETVTVCLAIALLYGFHHSTKPDDASQ